MRSGPSRPLVVGIAGGSGSGKTHLAREIVDRLEGSACMLSMDQYFRTEIEDPALAGAINFDHPSHLNFRQMIRDVERLKSGKSARTPYYDFKTMSQTPRAVLVEALPILIVEGLFVLAEPMVSLCDLTCFLNVEADERLLGRILRDLDERSGTIEGVVDRYQRFVRPSYQIFVAPTMQNADVVVDFTYRRALFTELFNQVLQSYLHTQKPIEVFLDQIRQETYHLGLHPELGYLSLTTDIFQLAKAYPESSTAIDGGRQLSSPALTSFGQASKREDHRPR